MAKRILVTGASGYLGNRLVRELGPGCVGVSRSEPKHSVGAADWRPLDLADAVATEAILRDLSPDAIVHCAAAQAGDTARALNAVNADATAQLAHWAARRGTRLVYISSDMVHGGDAGPYSDEAMPTPITAYGRSKAEGERAVLAASGGAIVRTSLIFGLDAIDRGTASLLDRIEAGQELSLWQDVIRQPMEIGALCDAIEQLVERVDVAGVVNVAGADAMSRADFALALLRYWGTSLEPDDSRVSLVTLGRQNTVPLDLRLSCGRAASLGLRLPGVSEVVRH